MKKYKKGELKVEEILENNELVNEIKTNSNSEFKDFFDEKNLKILIDYCIKMPKEDKQLEGHKFPFNACEILCSENGLNLTRLIEIKDSKDTDQNDEDDKKDEQLIDDDIKDDDVKDDIKEDETKTDETKPEEVKTEETKTEETKPEEAKSEETKTEETKSEETKTEEVKSEETKTEEAKTDETKTEEVKTEEVKSEETKTEEVKSEETKTEEVKQEETKQEEELKKKEESTLVPMNDEEDQTGNINEKQEEYEDQTNYQLMNRVLDYLFTFLDNPSSDDDYVLVGYFGKIVTNLFGESKGEIMKYLLETRKDVISKLVKHIDRKAIGMIFESIIQATYDSDLQYNQISEFDPVSSCLDICESLVDGLNKKDTSAEGIEVICETLINAIITNSKEKFDAFITSASITEKFHNAVKLLTKDKDKRKGAYIIKMSNKITDVVVKELEKKVTPSFAIDDAENEILSIIKTISKRNQQSDYQKPWSQGGETYFSHDFAKFSEFVEPILEYVIKDLMSTEITDENAFVNSAMKTQKKISMKTLFEWEFVRSILDIIVNELNPDNGGNSENVTALVNIITKQNFFTKLLDMYLEYTNSNMFQNVFNQIVSVVVNKFTPNSIIEKFLETNKEPNKNIVQILIDSILNKNTYFFESKREMWSLNFSNDIDALKLIATSENEKMQELIKSTYLLRFYQCLIKQMNENLNKKLIYKEKIGETLYGKEEKEEEIPFSVVTFKETFEFRKKIFTMAQNGEDFITVENEEQERIRQLMIPQTTLDKDDDKDNELYKDDIEYEDEYEGDRVSDRLDKREFDTNENTDVSDNDESSNFNDLNYWNKDPSKLGINDDFLAEIED